MSWDAWLDSELSQLDQQVRRRVLKPVTPTASAARVVRNGRELVLFSSNDYLGLSNHPEVVNAYRTAGGSGPRGSALVCGFTEAHDQLQRQLAKHKATEAALLFPTGFAANLATMAVVAAKDVAIFSDALNHASIIDGIALARRKGATLNVYRHADVQHLSHLLRESTANRKVIITDGVFSMDGDLAPLRELAALKHEHGALLVVDDAHGFLVYPNGAAGEAGAAQDVDLHIGTLSKAAGAQGGFVAASRAWIDLLLNAGRSFVFSTALPVPVVKAAQAGIRIATTDPSVTESLWARVEQMARALDRPLTSPIVPVVVGGEERALALAVAAEDAGFHIIAIRPPTVPEGTARLRIVLSAAHSSDDVAKLTAFLAAQQLLQPS